MSYETKNRSLELPFSGGVQVGLIAGTVLSAVIGVGIRYVEGTKIATVPSAETATAGSIVPSNLEITCLEGKRADPCTAVATYHGKQYLLRDGKNGVEMVPYVIRPVPTK